MSTKSGRYCCLSDSQWGYLLLCEVALGDMEKLSRPKSMSLSSLPNGKKSVMCLGKYKPDPATSHRKINPLKEDMSQGTDKYEVRVPIGRAVLRNSLNDIRPTTLEYNEFIIYDPDQVVIRYIVKVKSNRRN